MTSEALQPEPGAKDARHSASFDRLRQPMLAHAQSFVRDWKEADAITKSAFAQLSAVLASGEAVRNTDAWLRKKIQEMARERRPGRAAEVNGRAKKIPAHQAEPVSREARIRKLEEELVRTARRGNASVEFNRFFAEYAALRQRMLEAIARRITQSSHAAEDVVQDAFVALHHRLSDEHIDGEMGPWLTRVVRNIAVNHVRKVRTRRAIALDARHMASDRSPDNALASTEMAARMWKCVAGLPEIQRRIVELRTLEGMDFASIGDTLGIPPARARRYYYRAVARVRDLLAAEA